MGTFGRVRGASDAELRWQAFTTLAYGSKALGWFCYLTEVNYGNWNNWEDMVINRDGTRTRHYAMLKYLNGEVLAWADAAAAANPRESTIRLRFRRMTARSASPDWWSRFAGSWP